MSEPNSRIRKLIEAYAPLSRRAAIFEYPVRAMQARGWIAETNDTNELEQEMLTFFGVERLQDITTASLVRIS